MIDALKIKTRPDYRLADTYMLRSGFFLSTCLQASKQLKVKARRFGAICVLELDDDRRGEVWEK